MGPQLFGEYLDTNGGSCASGAIAIGLGVSSVEKLANLDSAKIYNENEAFRFCPACELHHGNGVFPHLNDEHRWSREQIADWLEGIEDQVGIPRTAEVFAEPELVSA